MEKSAPVLYFGSGSINDAEKAWLFEKQDTETAFNFVGLQDALEAEIRVLRSKIGIITTQCEEFRRSEKLLIRQNAQIIEDGIQFVQSVRFFNAT